MGDTHHRRRGELYLLTFGVALSTPGLVAAAGDKGVDFAEDIRPILANHCFECHGTGEVKGGLHLTSREQALAELESGKRAIVPGKPGESELLRRVTAEDPDVRMPKEGEPLSDEQVETLRRWIEQGASWPKHWAFRPLERPSLPEVENTDWPANPVDRFVLAKLEEEGVEPSPRADRYTLIRRLYYDLLGLPPSPDAVERFVHDRRPGAYERLVDRLLSSPHFGERWGRHWLDKARYADSDGYEKDRPRPNAWRYRDWVIDAVNADMPFDKFTIKQLAGDLLPDASPSEKLATAFHRQTLTNTEGGTDPEEFRVKAVFDRTETTGTVWLGLTFRCARCHDHKYDRITQREYYQLYAFFNSGDEKTTQVPRSSEAWRAYQAKKTKHEKQVERLKQTLRKKKADLAETLPEWEEKLEDRLEEAKKSRLHFHDVNVQTAKAKNGAELVRQDDGSFFVRGKDANRETYTVVATASDGPIRGFRVDALADERLPAGGPGRSDNGNFVLSELVVKAAPADDPDAAEEVTLERATADFSQDDWAVAGAVDGKKETGWAVAPKFGENHHAVFRTAEPIATDGPVRLTFRLVQAYDGGHHNLGRFRIRTMTGTDPASVAPEKVRQVLAIDREERTEEQRQVLLDHYAAHAPSTASLIERLEKLKANAPEPPLMKVRIIRQRKDPRKTHVMKRGDFLRPQERVKPDTPDILPPLEPRKKEGPPDRLDLARWLVDEENPLTPRVTVNHIWSYLFGKGLVRTMNNFGVRGEGPTHPDLLDWLATEYRRRGWSRKAMIRLIVTSATYQQASRRRKALASRDPNNKLLHRQNRFRVHAEVIRDLSLAVSGRLARKIGGPSVFPPMPPDVADISYANNFSWDASEGADRYRRGMYTFFKRTAPHPNLMTFDCPDSVKTVVQRKTSNTPLQALTAMNNRVFVEAARALAGRVLRDRPDADDRRRVGYAFRRCLARPPEAAEAQTLLGLLQESRAWYERHPDAAEKLIQDDKPDGVAAEEAAAWVATARTLLNTDEFVTRE